MQPPAFFTADGDQLVPHPDARSPWGDRMLHGRLLAALAARSVVREQLEDGWMPARLTVDMFRAASMSPVQVVTTTVRRGGRVKSAEVRITSEGREVVRATAEMLKTAVEPPGRVWSPPSWTVPGPGRLAPPPPGANERFPMEIRMVGDSGFGHFGPRQLWVREVRPLVDGEETPSFARVVGAADLANPFGNSGDDGLQFINADLNVHLARLPTGEWIGLDVSMRASHSGVAVAGCDLYDEVGLIGSCSVSSVANARLAVAP